MVWRIKNHAFFLLILNKNDFLVMANTGETKMAEQVPSNDKATIFRREFDEFMVKHQFSEDTNAIALREKVVEWLRYSTGGDLVVEGFSAGVGKMFSEVFENQLLKEKVDQLILKVATLEATAARVEKLEQENKTSAGRVEKLEQENKTFAGRVEELEQENHLLQRRLTSLEDDKTEKSLNISISDLGRMYAKYVIVPLLPKFLGSSLPSNDDGQMTAADFDKWIDPLACQLGVDLKLLMERIKVRNLDSHCDIRSVQKQSAFLSTIPIKAKIS